MEYISAIIVAAGKGSRMEAGLPKQFLELAGKTILYRTLDVFGKNKQIDEIIVVLAAEYLESRELERSLPASLKNKTIKLVAGGASRQESVQKGLKKLNRKAQIVLVHDGVRPFLTTKIINDNITECQNKQAVLTAFPVTDTLKEVKEGCVVGTLNRDKIWRAQTPQTFQTDLLRQCFQKANASGIVATDEAGLVEKYHPVYPIKGHKNNFKITHREDLILARALYGELTNGS